jgi:hypothetical protein
MSKIELGAVFMVEPSKSMPLMLLIRQSKTSSPIRKEEE